MYVHLIIIVPLLLESEGCHMVGLSFRCPMYVCFIPGCLSNSLPFRFNGLNETYLISCHVSLYIQFSRNVEQSFNLGIHSYFLGTFPLLLSSVLSLHS